MLALERVNLNCLFGINIEDRFKDSDQAKTILSSNPVENAFGMLPRTVNARSGTAIANTRLVVKVELASKNAARINCASVIPNSFA